jgi:hypothetical protein
MTQVHNAIRHYAALASGIKRSLGLAAEDEGPSRVGETVTPTFDVFGIPEHALHRGENRYSAGLIISAGGAGAFVKAMIRNMSTTKLAVMESVYVSSSSSQGIYLCPDVTGLANTSAQGSNLDGRAGGGLASLGIPVSCLSWAADATTPGTPMFAFLLGAGAFIPLRVSLVCKPGQALLVRSTVANVELYVSFMWREREALPGELGR